MEEIRYYSRFIVKISLEKSSKSLDSRSGKYVSVYHRKQQ